MSEDWSIDVRRYAPDADQRVIDAIIRHCGIALQRRESSLVSFTEPTELATVRESYLKKKLGLTLPDSELDAGIARVGERMRGDSTRNRATVYYLLAEHFRKLSAFGGRDEVVSPRPSAMSAESAGVAAAAVAGMPERPVERPTVVESRSTPERAYTSSDRPAAAVAAPRPSGLMRWLPWLVLGALALLLLWWLFSQRTPQPVATAPAPAPAVTTPAPPAAAPPTTMAPATPATPPAPATATAPAAAIAGFPARVFFATDSAAIGPEGTQAINQAAAAAKDGERRVAVTGFTDRTGDRAHNEELAKNRAVAVRDALVAAGVPATSIEMRPPMMVEVGAAGRDADARRVEISAR